MENQSSLTRRALLALGAALPLGAAAASWPERPVKIVVAAGPGSQPDIFARMYAERFSAAWKVPVVVENKTGATGNVGADAVAKSQADGLTLLYGVANLATMNPFLYSKMPFDPLKDLAPVAEAVATTTMLVAAPSVPANTLSEALALARTRKGEFAYGSYGAGGYPHLVFVVLLQKTGLEMLHVPFRTGAMTELIAGRIQFLLEPTATAIPQIQGGRIKALAHSGSRRHPDFPDLPTISEIVPGVVLEGWHGFWAPAGTPRDIVQQINSEVNRINTTPEMQKRLQAVSGIPRLGTPAQMHARIEQEAKEWGAVIRSQGIKLD